jgi:hypothetical protein
MTEHNINDPSGAQAEATYHKNLVLFDVIKEFSPKDKRRLFTNMRNQKMDVDSFFPHYGFTCGEFSTFAILSDNSRKRKDGPDNDS